MQSAIALKPRQFSRANKRLPVLLVVKHLGEESQHTVHTVDISPRGMRILTGEERPPLETGQPVYAAVSFGSDRRGYAKVVWANWGEAGLLFLT